MDLSASIITPASMRTTRLLPLISVLLGAIAPGARAQIVAPLLENHAIEGGYAYKWFDRDVPTPVDAAEWEVASIFVRFGGFDWLTISAEGGLWNVDHDGYPDDPYTRWVVGGGLAAAVYRAPRWSLTATVNYNEVFDHDNSDSQYDKRTRGWNIGLLAGTSFDLAGQRLDVWAGPMFVDDLIDWYSFGVDDPLTVEPDNQFGAAAGLYAVVFDYISGFTYVLYADEPQLRVGIALRSRGGD